MKADLTFEQLERRRRNLRRLLLAVALLFSCAGFVALAVPPTTPIEQAIFRAFLGISLLVAGFLVAAFSLFVP
jgi:hypothetical protein